MDLSALSGLLVRLQSGDNMLRTGAESELNTLWLDGGGNRPGELLIGLAQLATAGDNLTQQSSAAVILRRCATRVAKDSQTMTRVIDDISPEARAQVRELVLNGMLAPGLSSFVRHKLGDAVAELARPSETSREASAWPGLLETVAAAARDHQDATVRETAFRVLGAAPELVEEREDMMSAAVELLLHGFEDSAAPVRTTATVAFSAFFAYLPKRTWHLFKPLLPALLNVMEPLRQNHHEDELSNVLESLVTLAEIAPRMFAPVFGTLVDFTLSVAGDTDFDEPPRMIALELMAAFAEEAPNMCRSEPKYVRQLLPQLLHMLTEIGIDDDDASAWNATDDNEQVEEEEAVHREAKLAIDRISLSLGGEVVAPVLFEYLPLMFRSEMWRERVAGLMALSNAAEGCREAMLPALDQILHAVEPLLHDPHPRVQWSACNAMGQLSTDLTPQVQENYGALILPGVVAKLGPESVYKVQAHAAAALVNFSDGASKEVMDPFLDEMLSRLVVLIQSPKRYVQEQALTTIAIVADSAEQLFTKYYDTLMPLVINILRTNVPREYRLLKAKAIECSTLIALAVGKEKFAPQFRELADVLIEIQMSTTDDDDDDDDPCERYLMQSWGRLCRVIGQEFMSYISVVLPPLLTAARSTAECHILDVDQAESLRDVEGWEVIKYSGQWLGINTALFEDKATAIELLQVYPRELGGAFWPWAQEILNDVVHPGVKFYYNIRVRVFSCQLIPHLIVSAQQAYAANPIPQNDVDAMWRPLLATLLTGVLRNERETPALFAEAFLTIYRALELIGPTALQGDEIDVLCQSMAKILTEARVRVETRAEEEASKTAETTEWGEYEEGEDEEEDEEATEDEEVLDASNKLVHALLKTYGADLLATAPFAALMQLLPQFCGSPVADVQLWALEVVGDLAEFGKAAAAPMLIQGPAAFVGQVLAQHAQASPLVRASAAHAMGRLVLSGTTTPSGDTPTSDIAALAMTSLEPLFAIALAADARSEDNIEATERASGAIARILRTHGPAQLSAEQFGLAVGEWLRTLPITQEADGASFSYLFLAELLEKKHPAVLGNLEAVVAAVVKALAAQTLAGSPAEFTTVRTKEALMSLPQEQQMALFGKLDESEQQLVQQIFS